MTEEKMDVVVVGAGVAGIAASMKLAKEGLKVLLVDRGKPIGSKNLSGGVLWGHDLDEVFPDWWKEGLKAGAVERPVTSKGVGFLTSDSQFKIQFETESWKREPYNAFTVLRARFDRWLSEQASKMGVLVVDGINVEGLARDEEGRVVGVVQMGETIPSNVVLLADGANSRLTMELGIRGKLDRRDYVLGVKEIIRLPEKTLEERFHISPEEGVAEEYVLGFLENGVKAGGFLYTNRDTLSLGVVVNLESLWEKGVYAHEIMERFRLHPSFKNLLKGGELVEYGAHLIPEAGLRCTPQLFGNGWLVAGDAAGFVYSNGLVIHGMNYAIRSGILAAEQILEAHARGDFTAHGLAGYQARLQNSFIFRDLQKFDRLHEFVWDDTIHTVVPGLLEGVFTRLFTADGSPKLLTQEILKEEIRDRNVSLLRLVRTALKARRSV